MDVDQLGAFHTLARGMELDDNAFALDAFREIGPGQHYLGAEHTLANYEQAYYDFSSRTTTPTSNGWPRARSISCGVRCAAGGRSWRRTKPPPLDAASDEALRDYFARRKAELPDGIG